MSNNPNCDVDGNGDFYGLGIRQGFYAQWASTLIVKLFVHDEIPAYRIVNLLLQLAVIVCLVFMSARRTIRPPEVMIAFWLLVGSPSALQWGLIKRSGIVVRLFRVALYAALSVYGCWFWFGGVDGLPQMPCESFGFLGGVTTNGGLRWLGKVVSIGGLGSCVGVFVCIARNYWARRNDKEAATGEGTVKRPRSKVQERPQTDILLVFVSIFVMALSIISTECLIVDNHLVGVNDILEPGQLIPLIVGAFGLLGAVTPLFEGSLSTPQCFTLMGHHFT